MRARGGRGLSLFGIGKRFGADLNKTRRGVGKEYFTRTKEVWESKIVQGKVEAQNTWGNGFMKYSL